MRLVTIHKSQGLTPDPRCTGSPHNACIFLVIHSKEGVIVVLHPKGVSLRSHGLLSVHVPGQLHVTHLSHDLGRHVIVQMWAYKPAARIPPKLRG